MKIQIGNNRTAILRRNAETGEWTGTGGVYRIRLKRLFRDGAATWTCRVFDISESPNGKLVAKADGHQIKWAVQEATRLADNELATLAAIMKDIKDEALVQ